LFLGNFLIAAPDLTVPPQTNRMRYHKNAGKNKIVLDQFTDNSRFSITGKKFTKIVLQTFQAI
jgi:hypothetical protein